MTITAIEPRRRQMCALFIDGEYVMNLDAQTLIENRFDVGREIDDDELKELFDKLRRDFDEDSAQKAVDRMQELGLINDGEFAKAYARKLVYGKKMSLRAAELELRRKGIDEITAEQALSELEYDAQTQIIEFISKKYRNIEDEKVRRRAVAALQRKGYGWDDIKQAIESMSGDFD